MTQRVLMIITSHSQLGNTGKLTGVWAEELVVPYYQLVDAGIEVDLVSPLGGAVAFEPLSIKPPGDNDPLVDRFLADAQAKPQLRNLPVASGVDPTHFDAVFFPGGHGAMWDLADDASAKRAVETAFASGQLIASVCHGAAALVSARRSDGRPVVEGIKINSFTDAEEDAVGLSEVVPFKLEKRLRELGAVFEGAPNWQPFAVRDGQFITGQNPQSSLLVAKKVLEALT